MREKLQSGQSAPRTLLSRRKGKRVLRKEAFERLHIRKEKPRVESRWRHGYPDRQESIATLNRGTLASVAVSG